MQRGLRRQMSFLGVIERAGETIDERRLGFGQLGRRQALMAFRHAGEAIELGAVALERHDERAVGDGAGIGLAPQREAAAAKIARRSARRFPSRSSARAWRRHRGCTHAAKGTGERSHSVTLCPRRASVSACHRPTTPAPRMAMLRACGHARKSNPRAPRLRGVDRRRLRARQA